MTFLSCGHFALPCAAPALLVMLSAVEPSETLAHEGEQVVKRPPRATCNATKLLQFPRNPLGRLAQDEKSLSGGVPSFSCLGIRLKRTRLGVFSGNADIVSITNNTGGHTQSENRMLILQSAYHCWSSSDRSLDFLSITRKAPTKPHRACIDGYPAEIEHWHSGGKPADCSKTHPPPHHVPNIPWTTEESALERRPSERDPFSGMSALGFLRTCRE